MKDFRFDGGYGQFCKYRPARVVWREFREWWERNHPGADFPSLHNLPALTGLPLRTVQHLDRIEKAGTQNCAAVD